MDLTQSPPQSKKFGVGEYILMASLVIIVIIVGWALSNQSQGQPKDGLAPDFAFTTFDGDDYNLSDMRGQIVVLNFWASWCVPCKDEAPALQATWEAYEGRGVQFLGIAYADNGPRSLQFLEDYGITYLNAPDKGTRISEEYGIQGVPETFIIDQNGQVAEFIYAGVTEEALRSSIDRLLVEG